MSWAAQADANFFLEDAAIDLTEEIGERLIYFIKKISEEGDTERFQDFKDVVGQANGLMMEEIRDIPLHKFGLSVHNVNNDEMKQYVQSLAEKLVAAQALDIEVLSMLLKIDNWKYAAVFMMDAAPVADTNNTGLFNGPVVVETPEPRPVGAPPTNSPVPEQGVI
jgi:hypothetical protein